MSDYRMITKTRLSGIADQVRRLDNTDSPLSPAQMEDILSGMGQAPLVPGYIYANPAAEINLTNAWAEYPLCLFSQYGNYFEITEGKIVCKKACVAEVCGSLYFAEGFSSGDIIGAYIVLNGVYVAAIGEITTRSDPYEIKCGGPAIVELNAGDEIVLHCRNTTASRGFIRTDHTASFVYIKVLM